VRGLELAEEFGDLRNQLRLLEKLHVFFQRTGECREAFALAQRSRDVAATLGDATSIATANWTLGFSNYFAGDNISAEANWTAVLLRPDSSRTHEHSVAFDPDTRARTRGGLGCVLWVRGFPDQAIKTGRAAIKEAVPLRDPWTFCTCLIFTSSTFLRNGNRSEAEEIIERLLTQARKHSLAPYEAIGIGLRGTLLIDRGEAQTGVELVRDAIETLHAGRYELHNPTFLGTLAKGLMLSDRFDEALVRIDEAIARVERNGQLLFLPELLRIKGTIRMAGGQSADFNQAEDLFLRSLEISKQQSALAWALRAATSAAELRIRRDRIGEARDILAPVYSRFTEGFESSDLKQARALLDRLR
jgi:tetratricopeptide (TPR) repeat protein